MLKIVLKLLFITGLVSLLFGAQLSDVKSNELYKIFFFETKSSAELYLVLNGKFGDYRNFWHAFAEKQDYFRKYLRWNFTRNLIFELLHIVELY